MYVSFTRPELEVVTHFNLKQSSTLISMFLINSEFNLISRFFFSKVWIRMFSIKMFIYLYCCIPTYLIQITKTDKLVITF